MGSSAVDTALLTTLDGAVLTLTLNRPDRRNAIDPELRDALAAARERREPEFRGC
jgi:enoyl-CoA hydratase/carnithine racemase